MSNPTISSLVVWRVSETINWITRSSVAIPGAAALLALIPRLWVALNIPAWADETNTLGLLQSHSGIDLALKIIDGQPHFPTYYLLVDVVPPTILAVRSLSIFASVLTVAIIVDCSRRRFGLWAAVASGSIAALSPYFIFWGVNARPYSFLGLAVAVALWGTLVSYHQGRYIDLVGAVAAGAIHPFGLFILGLVGGRRLVETEESMIPKSLIAVFGLVGGVVTTIALQPLMQGVTHIDPPSTWLVLWTHFGWILGYQASSAQFFVVVVVLGLLTLGAAVTGVGDVRAHLLLAAWVTIPVVVTAGFSYLVWPVYAERYLMVSGMAWVVWLGSLVERLPTPWRPVAVTGLTFAALEGLPRTGTMFF